MMTLVRQYPDESINQITVSSIYREVAISASYDLCAESDVMLVAIILFYLNKRLDGTSQLDKSRLRTILHEVWREKFNQHHEQAAEQAMEQATGVRPSRRCQWRSRIKSCYRRLVRRLTSHPSCLLTLLYLPMPCICTPSTRASTRS